MNLVDSVTYRIPGDAKISAVIGREYCLTAFRKSGEIVKEIQIHEGHCALIVTDVQSYRISWWRVLEWYKETRTGA